MSVAGALLWKKCLSAGFLQLRTSDRLAPVLEIPERSCMRPVVMRAVCSRARSVFSGLLLLGSVTLASPQPVTNQPPARNITLQEVVDRVLEYNESVQMKMLEAEISRKTVKAEQGIFEPAVTSSLEHLDSKRPNNVQEQRALLTSELDERNNLYDGGLEFLSPIGSRFKLGVSLHELRNNLQQHPVVTTNIVPVEYETFIGVSVVQPLLKNFGVNATTVRIRLAAAASDLAFQDYRRQLMLTVGRAESAYWDLYLTQEQERISAESIAIADAVLVDNQNRLRVGRTSEMEVLQAEAGLSLRRARYNEARVKRIDGVSQLATLLSAPAVLSNLDLRAVDQPAVRELPLTYFDSYQQAFQLNPDYLARKITVNQETIRLGYARNQRLPQMDLKANLGYNGLGQTPGDSWDDVGHADFPVWSVGLEMRIPVTGGVRERNELAAAKLGQQRALLGLKEIEIQIGNALDSSMRKTRSYLDNVQSYRSVVEFHEQLLASQMDRLRVGRIDSFTVLETEEKLFDAKIAELQNMVDYQKAFLEMELVTGSTLLIRNLDITKPQLQARTAAYLKDRLSDAALEKYARDAAKDYREDLSPKSLTTRRALDVLHQEIQQQDIENQRQALEQLRNRVQQLDSGASTSPNPTTTPAPTATAAPTGTDSDMQRKAIELLRQRMQENQP
jgi:outer membrane protein TolC